MSNQNIQNYLEDFSPEDLEKASPFIQDAFSRVKYAFNSRLNFKDCPFTVDFAKEELTRFVSLALKEEEKIWGIRMTLYIILVVFLLVERNLAIGCIGVLLT